MKPVDPKAVDAVMRKLTARSPPPSSKSPLLYGSIRQSLATCPTVESLHRCWMIASQGITRGELQPDEKTLRLWKEAVGQRTVELMESNPQQAMFVYNTMFTHFAGEAQAELYREFLRIVQPVPYKS